MRILYQFPLSHYCEKARWLLDHKELDYVAKNLTPGMHRLFVQVKSGQHRLPMLKDEKVWVADSTDIAEYLDQHYPEHALLRKDTEQLQAIMQIDHLSQELGVHVRRWLFSFDLVRKDKSHSIEIILGEKGVLRDFEKISVPVLKVALKKMHNITDERSAYSKKRIDEIIAQFNQILTENGGRYLIGDRLSLADISVCSMMAPLLLIKGTPWEIADRTDIEAVVLDHQSYLLDLPIGQYVQRIYENERNAAVDWRGV